ncbi:MAG: glycosyltransferase family A protein [Eubacteriales bacterium]|nr:glycosyltransferase family A protein [Eubacteriales bacterium]
MPKFSIIVPVYNAEQTIKRCIDSIIEQDFKDYEIILINDGSSDKSEEKCLEYAEKYDFVKYQYKTNGGVSSARNAGLDIALGDYILFVDSDDYVADNYFECLKDHCIKNGVSIFTYSWVKKNGVFKREIATKDELDVFDKTRSIVLNRTVNSPYSKVFSKSLLETLNLRFDERMPVAEDFNFCLRYVLNCKRIEIIDESVYFYDMTNDDSLVHKRKDGLIDIYPVVFDYAYESIINSDFNESQKRSLLRVWDKLHTDSFITCVIEEIKNDKLSPKEAKKEIKSMCEKFYSVYKTTYGYENIIHFAVRFCIKYKFVNTLYYLSKLYFYLRK